MNLPKLYKTDSKGKLRVWTATVLDSGLYTITAGLVKGKKQHSQKQAFPKNVGKANETTEYDQAVSECWSLFNKKIQSGYKKSINEAQERKTLPMLAQSYDKCKHRLSWPLLTQPKLNGIRCIATRIGDKIEFKSRKDNIFTTLDHLVAPLLSIMKDGQRFDGEIFIRGMALQDIRKLLVKYREGETELLEYWIYDLQSDDGFTARYYQYYNQIGESRNRGNVKRLYCDLVYNEAEMKAIFQKHIAEGYEGIILRDLEAPYQFGKRSHYLVKYKEFFDEEFLIVGATAANTGREEGCVMWECVTETGLPFTVRPKGSHKDRRELYKDYEAYVGKWLTVRYQEKSNNGTPTILTGIAIRDYE